MKKRIKKLALSMLAVIVTGVLYAFLNIKTGMGIPCLFNVKTGLLCPGCGVTRMICSLITFDIKEAFYYNRLIFVLIPVFIYYAVRTAYQYIKNENVSFSKTDNVVFCIILILMILFGIIRNIL